MWKNNYIGLEPIEWFWVGKNVLEFFKGLYSLTSSTTDY